MNTQAPRAEPGHPRPLRRRALAVAATTIALLGAAAPAAAHTPVLLGPDDTAQHLDTSPLAPTGIISFAFYTRTGSAGDTRAVRIQLTEGQPFHAQLLIPDLAPETGLPAP